MEVQDRPSRALSNGANALNLRPFQPLAPEASRFGEFVRGL